MTDLLRVASNDLKNLVRPIYLETFSGSKPSILAPHTVRAQREGERDVRYVVGIALGQD